MKLEKLYKDLSNAIIEISVQPMHLHDDFSVDFMMVLDHDQTVAEIQTVLSMCSGIFEKDHTAEMTNVIYAKFCHILKKRWENIQGTSFAYPYDFKHPTNRLCLRLATLLSEHSGADLLHLLMPTLRAGTSSGWPDKDTLWNLQNYFLTDDNTELVDVPRCLDNACTDQVFKRTLDEKSATPLTESEKERLRCHSRQVSKCMDTIAFINKPRSLNDTFTWFINAFSQHYRHGMKVHSAACSLIERVNDVINQLAPGDQQTLFGLAIHGDQNKTVTFKEIWTTFKELLTVPEASWQLRSSYQAKGNIPLFLKIVETYPIFFKKPVVINDAAEVAAPLIQKLKGAIQSDRHPKRIPVQGSDLQEEFLTEEAMEVFFDRQTEEKSEALETIGGQELEKILKNLDTSRKLLAGLTEQSQDGQRKVLLDAIDHDNKKLNHFVHQLMVVLNATPSDKEGLLIEKLGLPGVIFKYGIYDILKQLREELKELQALLTAIGKVQLGKILICKAIERKGEVGDFLSLFKGQNREKVFNWLEKSTAMFGYTRAFGQTLALLPTRWNEIFDHLGEGGLRILLGDVDGFLVVIAPLSEELRTAFLSEVHKRCPGCLEKMLGSARDLFCILDTLTPKNQAQYAQLLTDQTLERIIFTQEDRVQAAYSLSVFYPRQPNKTFLRCVLRAYISDFSKPTRQVTAVAPGVNSLFTEVVLDPRRLLSAVRAMLSATEGKLSSQDLKSIHALELRSYALQGLYEYFTRCEPFSVEEKVTTAEMFAVTQRVNKTKASALCSATQQLLEKVSFDMTRHSVDDYLKRDMLGLMETYVTVIKLKKMLQVAQTELAKSKPDEDFILKTLFPTFLRERWTVIQRSRLAYPYDMKNPANILCRDIAHCLSEAIGVNSDFLLMGGTLDAGKLGATRAHYYHDFRKNNLEEKEQQELPGTQGLPLRQYILSDDGTELLHVPTCLTSMSKDGVMRDPVTSRELTDAEKWRVVNHSYHSWEYYYDHVHYKVRHWDVIKRFKSGLEVCVSTANFNQSITIPKSNVHKIVKDLYQYVNRLSDKERDRLYACQVVRDGKSPMSFGVLFQGLVARARSPEATDYSRIEIQQIIHQIQWMRWSDQVITVEQTEEKRIAPAIEFKDLMSASSKPVSVPKLSQHTFFLRQPKTAAAVKKAEELTGDPRMTQENLYKNYLTKEKREASDAYVFPSSVQQGNESLFAHFVQQESSRDEFFAFLQGGEHRDVSEQFDEALATLAGEGLLEILDAVEGCEKFGHIPECHIGEYNPFYDQKENRAFYKQLSLDQEKDKIRKFFYDLFEIFSSLPEKKRAVILNRMNLRPALKKHGLHRILACFEVEERFEIIKYFGKDNLVYALNCQMPEEACRLAKTLSLLPEGARVDFTASLGLTVNLKFMVLHGVHLAQLLPQLPTEEWADILGDFDKEKLMGFMKGSDNFAKIMNALPKTDVALKFLEEMHKAAPGCLENVCESWQGLCVVLSKLGPKGRQVFANAMSDIQLVRWIIKDKTNAGIVEEVTPFLFGDRFNKTFLHCMLRAYRHSLEVSPSRLVSQQAGYAAFNIYGKPNKIVTLDVNRVKAAVKELNELMTSDGTDTNTFMNQYAAELKGDPLLAMLYQSHLKLSTAVKEKAEQKQDAGQKEVSTANGFSHTSR